MLAVNETQCFNRIVKSYAAPFDQPKVVRILLMLENVWTAGVKTSTLFNTLLAFSSVCLRCWRWSGGIWKLRWFVYLYNRRWGWGWCVLEGLEVVDDVISNKGAATKGPPVNCCDAERWMEVFFFW